QRAQPLRIGRRRRERRLLGRYGRTKLRRHVAAAAPLSWKSRRAPRCDSCFVRRGGRITGGDQSGAAARKGLLFESTKLTQLGALRGDGVVGGAAADGAPFRRAFIAAG